MSAIAPDGANQFRVKLAEVRGGRRAGVDPYTIARAIAAVMGACDVRSALGHPLLWNDYRVVLSREDFDALGALASALDRDLAIAMTREVEEKDADLVGELRISIVVDESDALARGEAVVRVAFVPDEKREAPKAGAMTVRVTELGARRRATSPRRVAYVLSWGAGRRASLELDVTMLAGRPHPAPPSRFIALDGAGAKINKEHFAITARSGGVTIARLASANPVEVNGRAIAAGESIDARPPITISLSKGDLVLEVKEP